MHAALRVASVCFNAKLKKKIVVNYSHLLTGSPFNVEWKNCNQNCEVNKMKWDRRQIYKWIKFEWKEMWEWFEWIYEWKRLMASYHVVKKKATNEFILCNLNVCTFFFEMCYYTFRFRHSEDSLIFTKIKFYILPKQKEMWRHVQMRKHYFGRFQSQCLFSMNNIYDRIEKKNASNFFQDKLN